MLLSNQVYFGKENNLHPPLHPSIQQQQQQSWGDCCYLQVAWIAAQYSRNIAVPKQQKFHTLDVKSMFT